MTASRLRLAIDATPLLGVRTGVGHVTARLIDELARSSQLDVRAYAISWRGREELVETLPSTAVAATRRFPARLTRLLWPRVAAPRVESWTGPVDVVHATNYVAPPAHAPVLLTVHDLTAERLAALRAPGTEDTERLVRVALARGAVIHTFSDFVAAEVRQHYGLPGTRVVRIAPGLTPVVAADPARGRTLAGADRYVLALGTVEPRKNLPVLVRAFDRVAATRPEVALVVAGPDGWGVEAFDSSVAAARHRDRIHRVGYLSEPDRASLLAGATLLAYPSRYEGFGHPPLEAMQVQVPVVAAAAGALPEVLGDAALLPDPDDVDALADAVAEVLDDAALRARLVERGLERVGRFSWDEAGREFLATYRRLATSGG